MQFSKYRLGRGTPINDAIFCGRRGPNAPLFEFSGNRATNSVSVENIPDHVNRREVVALFNSLIGEVRGCRDIRNGDKWTLEITFSDRECADKALCMNGFTVAGVPLVVSSTPNVTPSFPSNKPMMDDRRNLYVLGLPFALTKSEFASIFSQHGTVSHCVILATVDNSSRRRGFVVMSSHEEALNAMASLSHTVIKGHTIDVSWAVVQRSQGFLDGGDRAMLLEARSQVLTPSPRLQPRQSISSSDSSDSSLESHDADPASLATSSGPTQSLLVMNLPTLLFSQAQDLQPLFLPFGHIEKLEIVQVSPLGTMSVLVQYSHASVAQEAKENLTGQLYGSYRIEARYVRSASQGLPKINHAPSLSDADIGKRPSILEAGSSTRGLGHIGRSHSYSGFATKDHNAFDQNRQSTNLQPHLGLPTSTSSSVTPSPFSNVFDDSKLPSVSAGLRCDLDFLPNYGSALENRRSYALSNQLHFNSLYPNSAA